MKPLLLAALTFCFTLSAQADFLKSTEVSISPSQIHTSLRLVDKTDAEGSHRKITVTVVDNGLSTDVSPRFSVYLGYVSMAEMGNLMADFEISHAVSEFISAKRISAGVYEIVTQEYDYSGDVFSINEVIYTVDATQAFIDDRASRRECGTSFCDGLLNTFVKVTKVAKPIVD